MPVNDLIITPALGHLYIATDIGVFYSTDLGLHWELVTNGLPNVIITDLTYHAGENILVAATYGRGMYKVSPDAEVTSVENAGYKNPLRVRAYPNPFLEKVTVEFNVTVKQVYTIEMIDLDGSLVKSIYRGSLQEGLHSFEVEAGNLQEGIYFFIVTCQNSSYDSVVTVCRN
jgi:hypothetical protein